MVKFSIYLNRRVFVMHKLSPLVQNGGKPIRYIQSPKQALDDNGDLNFEPLCFFFAVSDKVLLLIISVIHSF